MALTATSSTASVSDANATTSITFTPASNSLVVALVISDDNTGSHDEVATVAASGYTMTLQQRCNGTGRVLLDGVQINGGQFQQGMVRNADGINTGSCHFVGMLAVTEPGQILTVTTELEAASGTVTVGSYYANIIVRRVTGDVGVYNAEATLVGGTDNWNPSTQKSINWDTDNLIDREYYSHDTTNNNHEITLNKDGDYFLGFNVAFGGAVARAVPKATVQVNGVDMSGLQSKAGYIRNTGGADSSSSMMLGFMPGLHAGDVITVSMDSSAATGTVTHQTPATLVIRGKNIPVATAYWFRV